MTLWMAVLIAVIIGQRLIELRIAKHNERWMKARGAIELGASHYKWFILVHIAFFISLIIEASWTNVSYVPINYFLFSLLVITQILRYWCIVTLGRFWNTKIIVLPRVSPIKKGPYKYIKHPNYLVVAIELFVIPLLCQAYVTAILFPILHGILLCVRIPIENKALTQHTIPVQTVLKH